MSTINELTKDQFKELLDEYFAPPEKRTKMSCEEIKDLAKEVRGQVLHFTFGLIASVSIVRPDPKACMRLEELIRKVGGMYDI